MLYRSVVTNIVTLCFVAVPLARADHFVQFNPYLYTGEGGTFGFNDTEQEYSDLIIHSRDSGNVAGSGGFVISSPQSRATAAFGGGAARKADRGRLRYSASGTATAESNLGDRFNSSAIGLSSSRARSSMTLVVDGAAGSAVDVSGVIEVIVNTSGSADRRWTGTAESLASASFEFNMGRSFQDQIIEHGSFSVARDGYGGTDLMTTGRFDSLGESGGSVLIPFSYRAIVGAEFHLSVSLSSGSRAETQYRGFDFGNPTPNNEAFAGTAAFFFLGSSLSLAEGGTGGDAPLFDLPEGYTIRSTDGLIVDNSVVPTPSAALPLLFGTVLCYARRRRADASPPR